MVCHVLAIYRAGPAGQEVVHKAGAIAEHGAQLTIGVMTGNPSRPGRCAQTGAEWDATRRGNALRELAHASEALGPALAHLAVIDGKGPRAIASAAERLRCDLVIVPVARLALRGGLARALRRRTSAAVIGVRAG